MPNTVVMLNVYDMTPWNKCTEKLGLGFYHTGLEVYDREYSYGAHLLPTAGVYEIPPRSAIDLNEAYKFRSNIIIGATDLSESEVEKKVKHIAKEYKGNCYHVLHQNCNHFTSALAMELCGKPNPKWVNRPAGIASCIPFIQYFLPREWFIYNDMIRTRQMQFYCYDKVAEQNPEQSTSLL